MNLTIITSVPHVKIGNQYFAYAPYVYEMNIWEKQADELVIVAPLSNKSRSAIDINYQHGTLVFKPVFSFDFTTLKSRLKAFFYIPVNMVRLFKAMRKADHIHLRCPGNVGLLGCIVQVCFPNKIKTAKYAGNWDPKAKQPWTYKLQKKILQNTFLTRNMQVLLYGEWEGQTKNCKSFFTASYYENEKEDLVVKNLDSAINFTFVGALVKGKNPLYAIQLVEGLSNKGFNVCLSLYGEGIERNQLEAYIAVNNLSDFISLKGNQSKSILKEGYRQSHFTLLPSESEGWPKAIAEGMFWGSVPLATAVSCVPFMLDYESRGVLLTMNLIDDIEKLSAVLVKNNDYQFKQKRAFDWSQHYTLDIFESEIKKLML